jgi:hypothetical protein
MDIRIYVGHSSTYLIINNQCAALLSIEKTRKPAEPAFYLPFGTYAALLTADAARVSGPVRLVFFAVLESSALEFSTRSDQRARA